MRTPIIAGNHKMNLTADEEIKFLKELLGSGIDYSSREVVVAPSFVNLHPVSTLMKESDSKISLFSQNVSEEDSGAYTGEVSCGMLKNIGVTGAIIGHSERRAIYGETDSVINAKVKKTLSEGLSVILCVGEMLKEREDGVHVSVVLSQVGQALQGISELTSSLVIAYEPVWAIGTGRTASAQDAQDMHASIRDYIADIKSSADADGLRILYGGSVKADNISELMGMKDIDGALVGGASLQADDFIRIINY